MDASAPLAVRCQGVTKSFGAGATRALALRGVDLVVRGGELLMLVGPSGCGKTTLISIIAGILDLDGGRCEVLGHDLPTMGAAEKTEFRRRSIGFVFQSYNLVPALTLAENVGIPLMIRGERRALAIAAAREMLARVGLADRANALPTELSGGQQQRGAVARALIHKPALIVCDEPTSALDHRTGQSLMELLKQVALKDGRSLVVVTHDSRIFGFADRIAEMDDGRIIATHRPQTATPLAVPHSIVPEFVVDGGDP